MRAAISFCLPVNASGSVANQSFAARIESRDASPICRPADLHRQRLRLQPEALAFLARRVGLVARQLLAHPLAVGLLPAPLDIGDDAFEGLPGGVGAHPVVIGERDGLAARAEQDRVLDLLRQLAPGRVHREIRNAPQAPGASACSRARCCRCAPRARWRPWRARARRPARSAPARISAPCPARRIWGRRRTGC